MAEGRIESESADSWCPDRHQFQGQRHFPYPYLYLIQSRRRILVRRPVRRWYHSQCLSLLRRSPKLQEVPPRWEKLVLAGSEPPEGASGRVPALAEQWEREVQRPPRRLARACSVERIAVARRKVYRLPHSLRRHRRQDLRRRRQPSVFLRSPPAPRARESEELLVHVQKERRRLPSTAPLSCVVPQPAAGNAFLWR
jgi:hypothetical protein